MWEVKSDLTGAVGCGGHATVGNILPRRWQAEHPSRDRPLHRPQARTACSTAAGVSAGHLPPKDPVVFASSHATGILAGKDSLNTPLPAS